MKDLVAGRISLDEKYQILLWLSGLPVTIADLRKIHGSFQTAVIVCLHLVKVQVVSLLEAECLMRSIFSTNKPNNYDTYPQVVNAKAFNTGFLYMKTFVVLSSCYAAVGLKFFLVS